MELIKRHKELAIICTLTLILLIIIFAIFSKMLFSSGKSEYGDRLNGIVKVKDSTLKKAKDSIKENDSVEEVTVRIQGKIIYTDITVKANTSKDKAKEIANKSLENYTDKVIECYDFEFLINEHGEVKEGEEDKSYIIAGTKHPNIDHISWTRN